MQFAPSTMIVIMSFTMFVFENGIEKYWHRFLNLPKIPTKQDHEATTSLKYKLKSSESKLQP